MLKIPAFAKRQTVSGNFTQTLTTTTNIIKAELKRTAYCQDEHLAITIDGKLLDEIISEKYPEKNLIGLIPTLLDWFDDIKERNIVWDKINNNAGIIPILMCPDDCDLWCTIIVAEHYVQDNRVVWKRLGLDMTEGRGFTPDKIGQTVEWFEKILPMTFSIEDFEACVNTFKKELTTSVQ